MRVLGVTKQTRNIRLLFYLVVCNGRSKHQIRLRYWFQHSSSDAELHATKGRRWWKPHVHLQLQVTLNLGGEKSGDPFSLLRSNRANAMQLLLQSTTIFDTRYWYKVIVYRYLGTISRQQVRRAWPRWNQFFLFNARVRSDVPQRRLLYIMQSANKQRTR